MNYKCNTKLLRNSRSDQSYITIAGHSCYVIHEGNRDEITNAVHSYYVIHVRNSIKMRNAIKSYYVIHVVIRLILQMHYTVIT